MDNLQFSYTYLHHLQYYYFFIESFNTNIYINITHLIIYMEKLLDSDWLRAVQFRCNTSAKSVTPV